VVAATPVNSIIAVVDFRCAERIDFVGRAWLQWRAHAFTALTEGVRSRLFEIVMVDLRQGHSCVWQSAQSFVLSETGQRLFGGGSRSAKNFWR
jgi:hypothetical protein